MQQTFRGAAPAALALGILAGCGPNKALEEELARRSPERVQQKTAEVLSPERPDSVQVSEIHLEERQGGKGLIVVWTAVTPGGQFRCNADKRVDFPICEVIGTTPAPSAP